MAALSLLCANTPPVIKIDAGPLRGETLGKGAVFRGIPFAAPPVGKWRWRDARPAAHWRGVRDASQFGPACLQRAEKGRPSPPQSEDCLNLNVVTPDLGARNLPVLVSIHGGAYAFGSNREVTDQGLSPLVARGVVLVAPNYRIGRFGFLAHPALTAEAGRGTGNLWLSDQILALDWVRRNIAKFGGDPDNVTIIGCSAGGSSVNALMATPQARGLFAKASVHSGGGLFNANRPLKQAERQGVEFARRAGVDGDGPQVLERLRSLTPEAILAADPGAPDFGAIVDGHFLSAPLSHVFARGGQARVPLITGSTSNEASVFGLMGFDAATLRSRFGIDLGAVRLIYESQFGTLAESELLRRVQTDFLFTSASLGMTALHSRVAPAWAYHFDYLPASMRGTQPGAAHCDDMPYLLGSLPASDERSLSVAAIQRDYLYNFIARSDPNGTGLPRWPATQPGRHMALFIGNNEVAARDMGGETMQFWFAKWKTETGSLVSP